MKTKNKVTCATYFTTTAQFSSKNIKSCHSQFALPGNNDLHVIRQDQVKHSSLEAEYVGINYAVFVP